MKNIKLDNISPLHKTGHTSKGDQRKWKVDGLWYKADDWVDKSTGKKKRKKKA